MQVMTEKKTLKQLRTELDPKVTQEAMAHASGVTLVTYTKVERGGRISYSTAQKVLSGLNNLRSARSLSPIDSVEDIKGLKIV